jgi:cell division protease FtsH
MPLKESLSSNEFECFERFSKRWKDLRAAHTELSKADVELAVEGLYLLAGLGPPTIFWCQNPLQAAIMPFMVEAILAEPLAPTGAVRKDPDLQILAARQESVFWRELWARTVEQVGAFERGHGTKFLLGRNPLGQNLTRCFDERCKPLELARREHFSQHSKTTIDDELVENLNLKLGSDLVGFRRRFLDDVGDNLSQAAAERLFAQFQSLSMPWVYERVFNQQTVLHAVSSMKDKLVETANLFNWQTRIPASILSHCFSIECWPDWDWQQSHIWEANLWTKLYSVFGWSMYTDAAFICENPAQIIYQQNSKVPSKLMFAGDFSLAASADQKQQNRNQDLSPGAGVQFYPEAFETKASAVGEKVANGDQFYSAFKKFVQLVLEDGNKIVSERMLIIREVQKIGHISSPITHVTWCALCYATERYFCEKAKSNNLNATQCEDLKRRWYEIISKGFVPAVANRTLNMWYLNKWRADYLRLIKNETIKQKKAPQQAIAPSKVFQPREISDHLDKFVVGQSQAKRILSVAVSNHFKRIAHNSEGSSQWEKSNLILVGPTGTGKTMLVETLAQFVDVPVTIVDATAITLAGYQSSNIENMVHALYQAADKNVERTERGIIYIDEIDKLQTKAQQSLLKLVENKTVKVDMQEISTKNILFVGGGVFDGCKRGSRLSRSHEVEAKDLMDFGVTPELVGRFPIIATLENLTIETLVRILTEPENATIRQYEEIFAMDDVRLSFDQDALLAVAEVAIGLGTGARGLKAIVDRILLDLLYDVKSIENDEITITRQWVEDALRTPTSGLNKRIMFADVAGNDGAKEDLMDVVRVFRNPKALDKFKANLPKGILLVGDPGNGKTLLAKALAGECGAEFLQASGSDFVDIWVGQGSRHVRELFDRARRKTPCVVFIDEIDAVGTKRNEGPTTSGGREYDQTLNALLVEMDGFDASESIVVIGATNRPDLLDPALLRPGRIDRTITVQPPTRDARKRIFELNLAGKQLEESLNKEWLLEQLTDRTPGQSGAFCAAIIEEASLLSVRRVFARADEMREQGALEEDVAAELNPVLRIEDFDEAIDKVSFGSVNEGNEAARSEEDVYKTAVHEVGHALVATLCKDYPNKITKVTVVSRAGHLGYMSSIPIKDVLLSLTKQALEASIMVSLGGRAATDVVLQIVDTGPRSDFEHALSLARTYVMSYGMSDLGIMAVGAKTRLSPHMSAEIDKEVQALINRLKEKTYDLISANVDLIKRIADRLLEQKTMLADEWYSLLAESVSASDATSHDGEFVGEAQTLVS